jgi:hypothetical protein
MIETGRSVMMWRRSVLCGVTAVALLLAMAIGLGGHTARAAAASAPAQPGHVLTPAEAAAQARGSHQAVPVPGSTTSTSTLTANADGSFTRNVSVQPVRKLVNGSWQALDATLHRDASGAVVPALTTSGLSLSGGGSAPMATMLNAGRSLRLSLPMALPTPTLSGPTATYTNVFPDVDLQVTADTQGGFREVFVVRTAKAAADPRLAAVTFGTTTSGVSVTADKDGNLVAADRAGRPVFTAPAPMAWDSAAAPAPTKDSRTGQLVDPARGLAATSTVDGPGAGAHRARIGVAAAAGSLRLTPPSLLTAAQTTFPVFLDPSWSSMSPTRGGYASVNANNGGSNYWNNTGDPNSDNLQVGDTGSWRAHTLLNFPIDASLDNAYINDVSLNMFNLYSYSCTKTATAIYAPTVELTQGNATWNAWFGSNPVALGPAIDQPVFANGYNSTCGGAPVGFDVTAGVRSAASAGRLTQTFVLTGVNETSDPNSWKKFSLSSINMTIHYNHKPTPPQDLGTSPTTACSGTTITTIGDGPVGLHSTASDVDNNVNLNVAYQLWRTTDPSPATPIYTGTVTVPPGSIANVTVPEATLKNAAGGAITQFSWSVVSGDDQPSTSDPSAICTFKFDPTRTGAPQVSPPAPGSATMAAPLTLPVTHPVSGTLPTSYLYQLNGGVPGTVTADASGNASITITPARFTNTLTVTSRSAGGNVGDSASVVFNAIAAADAADGDLTGDGAADLLTVGAVNSLPPGLWLASGLNTGQLRPTAVNIGTNGNGVSGVLAPTDFNAAQVITGRFSGGHLQDVLAYYPTGNFAGGAVIINGNGDGSVLQGQLSGNDSTISQGILADNNGDNPIRLANAGNSSGQGLAYPDLIATSGDSVSGYYLDYYVNGNGVGNYPSADQLTTPAPDGSMNWNLWTIATTQLSSGTAMFLYNSTTGALYLWTNLSHIPMDNGLSYTAYTLYASGWNPGTAVSLRAADINHDGTPDLWTTAAGGTVTSWLVTGLSGSPTITAQPNQALITAKHTWTLNDKPAAANSGAAVASTGDNPPAGTTALPLNATGGATWNTGDLYSPDIAFNGSSGQLAGGAAVTTNGDFSVSAWVKPTAIGGVVASQDGTQGAGFTLWTEPSDNSWHFAMSTSDSPNATLDSIGSGAGTVALGIWTQITATYKQSSGVMNLYVNGANVSSGYHTTTWNATGSFRLGAYQSSAGTRSSYFTGQLANVQTWDLVLEPAQALASYYHPMTSTRVLDTRVANGVPTTTPLPGNHAISVKVTGVAGIPASNVTAVALSVAVVNPSGTGYVELFPTGTPQPNVSAINYVTSNVANLVVANVGAGGQVDLYTSATTHVLADAVGYYSTDPTLAGATTFTPLNPTRFFDTRTGQGVPLAKVNGGSTLAVQIGGTGGVPSGIKAVVINLTTVSPSTAGYLEPYADGTTQPNPASGLQYTGGSQAGLAIVPVGANGKIDIFIGAGSLDLLGDVEGYYTAGTAGQKYHPIAPIRLNDTRLGTGGVTGPLAGNTVLKVKQNAVTAQTTATLMLNVTVTDVSAAGIVIAYPDNIATPAASNINYNAGTVTANAVSGAMATNGLTDLLLGQSGGTGQLVVDCAGYFSAN